ncbi:MAG: WD40 repeat domain-containing protein, partial [Limisphaerales bacterium]
AEPASEIVWDPRGRWISTLGQSPSDWGRGVRLIDAQSGAIILLGRHKIFTSGLSFSPDGNYLVSCGWERESIWWDLRTLQPAFACTDTGYQLAWGRDGIHYAMVPRSKRSLQLFTFERPACLELSGNHGERLRPGAFSPDGRWLALPEDQDLCVWDLTSSSPPVLLAEKVICPPFFSADSSELFAVAGPGGAARLKAWQIDCRTSAANRPSFRPLPVAECQGLTWAGLAGEAVILTGEEGVRLVALTNLAKGEGRFLRTVTGPGAISPGGRWLAVTHSYSPLVTVYGLPDLDKVAQLNTADLVGSVWFSPGGDELTVINRGGLEMWDTRTWRPTKREPGSPMSDSYVLYSPDGRGLWRVTAFRDAALCARGNLEPILPLPENVLPLALNSDGSRLAVSVDDQRVQVW